MIKRTYIFLLASVVVLFGSVVAALATAQQRDFELRGYVDATRTQDLPFRDGRSRLGVNAELTQYDDLTRQFDLMQAMGITWVRQIIPTDNWSTWDQIVTTIADYPQLELIAVLAGSDQPPEPDEFAAFAAEFATRYGQTVDYYQIWDEPNLASGWGGQNPNPAGYAALLSATYEAIHTADPQATVIAAGLAPTTETGPRNINEVDYLRDLYTLGAAEFADAFAAKPYGFAFPAADRRVRADLLNFSRVILLREVMVAHGDGEKALWASNWGWNSLPGDWTGEPSIWGEVQPNNRLNYTLAALGRAEREWPWLAGMVLQHWQPAALSDNPLWGFALIDQEGQPTELYEALAAREANVLPQNGLYPPRNPYARYSGIWQFGELGADIGWVEDSQFEFNFSGGDLALLVREGDYVAHFYPTITAQDGSTAEINGLPRDSLGNPYLLLQSGDLQPDLNLEHITSNLAADQTYTLHITADELVPDEIANRWPLVGFAISPGDLHTPYNRQITLAWISSVIALVAVVISARQITWGGLFSYLGRWLGDAGQIALSVVTSLALLAGMLLTWGDGLPALFRRDSVHLALSIATSGLIYVSEPGLILTLLALLVLFVLIYHRLEIGLMLVLFWSPFFLFPVELYRFAFPLAEMLMLVTVAAWVLRLLADLGRARQASVSQYAGAGFWGRIKPMDYAVAAWVLLGVISLTWAARRGIALTELRVLILEPALFYAIFRTIQIDRRMLACLVDALLLAGFAVAVIGLVMWLRGEAIITAEAGARRLASVYGSPNNVGLILGRCIPFALTFLLLKVDQRRRIFGGVLLAGMLPALLLTQSAGALFVGVPASVAAVILLVWRRRALLPLAGLVILVVLGALIALQSPRFARLLDFSEGTNFYRIRVWQSSLELISDEPLTGAGLDQFLYAFRDAYILPDAWEEPNLSHPHNIVLDFWVRLGLLGVGVLVALQVIFWRRGLRVYAHLQRRPFELAVCVGMLGSMVNLLTHGLVDNSVYVLDLAFVFVFLLGLPNTSAIDEASQ